MNYQNKYQFQAQLSFLLAFSVLEIEKVFDGQYITSINPTSAQMEDLKSNRNIGLDTRTFMQLTLRLRGPKNGNYL